MAYMPLLGGHRKYGGGYPPVLDRFKTPIHGIGGAFYLLFLVSER